MKCLYCYKQTGTNEIYFHPRCSKKIFGSSAPPELNIKLGDIYELASAEINKRISVPGVQKKLSIQLENKGRQTRLTLFGFMGNFILKPPSEEYPELPEVEDLTMHLAEIAGIETAKHSLIRLASGEIAYITKRFDRSNGKKIAVEDLNQLSENLTSDKYNGSLEKAGKLIAKYCDNQMLDIIRFFRLALFSFVTGNADMHLKNYSLMKYPDGKIRLSPSYDLLATKLLIPEDKEETALTLNGKKRNIGKGDFYKLAANLGMDIKVTAHLFSDLDSKIPDLENFISESFLSEEMKAKYAGMLKENAAAAGLMG